MRSNSLRIKEILAFPFILICSFGAFSEITQLFSNKLALLYQIIFPLLLAFAFYFFSNRISHKVICYSFVILSSVILYIPLAFFNNSLSNVVTLYTEHPPVYKFIVVWAVQTLAIQFSNFLLLSFYVLLCYIFKSICTGRTLSRFQFILLIAAFVQIIALGLLGMFEKSMGLPLAVTESLLAVSFISDILKSKFGKYLILLYAWLFINVVYIFIQPIL